jgi:hypothetical protein
LSVTTVERTGQGRRAAGRSALQLGEVVEHVLGVAGDVGDLVLLAEHTVGVDQEGPAGGVLRVLLARRLLDAVGGPDARVRVGQQAIREPLCLGELLVLRGGVERRPDDQRAASFELWASITEALSLDRSTSGRCLRIPPQHDPVAAEGRQRDELLVLVEQLERRCGRPERRHGGTLP